MAGIGFRLQALITKGSYLESTSAYLSSAVIACGPWLAGVMGMLIVSRTSAMYLNNDDRMLLLATIVSVFAASLLFAGGPQLLITRYLADCIYLGEIEDIAPTCAGVMFLLLPYGLLSVPFLLFTPFSLEYRLLVVSLFLVQTMIWLIATFLSAARRYGRIVSIFVCCYLVGAGASVGLGYLFGVAGSLAGFSLGQGCCLTLLLTSIYREFPSTRRWNLAYCGYVRKHWDTFTIGVVYNMGIWIDSLIFWFSPHAQIVHGFFHLFPPYDTTKFTLYFSTVPAAAVFMVNLETDFYRQYRRYYQLIMHKGTLKELLQARKGMMMAVRRAVGIICKLQGLIALFLCIIAPDLASWLGPGSQWVWLMRAQACAGLAQILLLVIMLFLLYIDQRRSTLCFVTLFMVCNGGFTLLSLWLGPQLYGIGYLAASLVSVVVGWLLLMSRLKQLEYFTFMKQPVR